MGRLRRMSDFAGVTRPKGDPPAPRRRWWQVIGEAVLVGICTLFVLWLFDIWFGWTIT